MTEPAKDLTTLTDAELEAEHDRLASLKCVPGYIAVTDKTLKAIWRVNKEQARRHAP